MSEFSLIEWLKSKSHTLDSPHVLLGIGDDACVLSSKHPAVWSMDTLVEGVHFASSVDPHSLGHKVLAVSVSDCIAMGAKPRSVLLSITAPQLDDEWLAAFFNGFFAFANQHQIALVGGDLSQGPLSVTTAVHGDAMTTKFWRRSGARAGDDIWVTGCIGLAALALSGDQNAFAQSALHRPDPPVMLAEFLKTQVHGCIDISDGFLQDLQHLLKASKLGAMVNLEALPWLEELKGHIDPIKQYTFQLYGGDDYQLCFTAPPSCRDQISSVAHANHLKITKVGHMTEGTDCILLDQNGKPAVIDGQGWEHFR